VPEAGAGSEGAVARKSVPEAGAGSEGAVARGSGPADHLEAKGSPPTQVVRLKKHFFDTLLPDLMKRLGYRNALQVPRLKKIVVNVGLGEAVENVKLLDTVVQEISMITGQRPVVTRSKRSMILIPFAPPAIALAMARLIARRNDTRFSNCAAMACATNWASNSG